MNREQVDKLASEGTYNGTPIDGNVVETHISWVILSGTHAFKIKKPVRLSFLDFSTIALRKKYCKRELELNRKWSDIYLHVSPVGTASTTIDYAVVMKRVDEKLRMDRLLIKNKVTASQIRNLAKIIANIHSKCTIVRRQFSLKYTQGLFNDIQPLARRSAKSLGPGSIAMINKAVQWSDQFLHKHQSRFRQRVKLGFQRDVHGDLHSANVFMSDRPVIFDCLEFNDRYRQIDVLYEVAFLAMDIEAFGHDDLSKEFIRAYTKLGPCLDTSEDRDILFYYKCLRANVRAKVHMIQLGQSIDPAKTKFHLKEVRRYLALMQEYMKGI